MAPPYTLAPMKIGEENVEVLAHPLGFIDPHFQWQAQASGGRIRDQIESGF